MRVDGADAARTAEAILSLLPLDEYVEAPAAVMAVVGEPEAELAIVATGERRPYGNLILTKGVL